MVNTFIFGIKIKNNISVMKDVANRLEINGDGQSISATLF